MSLFIYLEPFSAAFDDPGPLERDFEQDENQAAKKGLRKWRTATFAGSGQLWHPQNPVPTGCPPVGWKAGPDGVPGALHRHE